MKLSLKQKALMQAVGILTAIIVGSILTTLAIQLIPATAYPYIALGGLLIVALSLMYNIVLSRLEYQEKLKELSNTIKG